MVRTYTEMRRLHTHLERFRYLSLVGQVGQDTFGFDRWMNQEFYHSAEWQSVRHLVIVRDNGCDLGVEGYDIFDRIYIHHMNPMTPADLIHGNDDILDPEFLVACTHRTHNAIHYGGEQTLRQPFVERRPGDTKLW